jgi:poly(beta-D-mannuronate) lyase
MYDPFRRSVYVAAAVIGAVATTAQAGTTLVRSQDEFRQAVKELRPGHTIALANGVWRDFEIVFKGIGTREKPITLTAEEKGKVIISGQSNLRISGEYLVVSGLVFRDGHSPTSEVISFRRDSRELANHSRVTEVVIDHFNNPERTESDSWVVMYGRHNRFDHNHLAGKSNQGVTMAVRLNSEESQENHHRIDHNYFGPRPVLGSNGGETLRIGTSQYSMSNSRTLVESNFFERCDGEVEIISNKSGGNIYRGNVFLESRGTLTLRHGNDTVVERNIFLGNGVDHTGGIRVINKRQTVRNNYLHGLRGYRFGSALTVMNGVPDSPINRYHQVEDSRIENNSVIDSDHVELAAGSDAERSAVPLSTVFARNLIHNQDGRNIVSIHDDISGITFEGNVLNSVSGFPIAKGFESGAVPLEKAANGLLYPVGEGFAGVGASRDLAVLDRSDTGVSWYPKPADDIAFDTGRVHRVEPGADDLAAIVMAAGAGDVVELAPGNYRVARVITVSRPVTVRSRPGTDERKPVLEFERSALFEINDGGSLKLAGLRISGRQAPDAAGNTVVRTSRYSMLNPYRLLVEDCVIAGLDINHSFNFMSASKGTFADRIDIRGSEFSDVTGAILELDREADDLGLYNAEYVAIERSSFQRIGEAVTVLYRGGTDESTFGPHFSLRDSVLVSVGQSSRNKSDASILLHGVQLAVIEGNELSKSRGIRVIQTVGEPRLVMDSNLFVETPQPVVTDASMSASEKGAAAEAVR